MTNPHPSRRWHLASAALFISVAIVVPITMVFALIGQLSSGTDFIAPGTHQITVEKPGKYGIWNTTSEFRDGMQRAYSTILPDGTRIRVLDSDQTEIPTKASSNFTESSGSTSRNSICNFKAETAGVYTIIVDGLTEERPMMIRRSISLRALLLFIAGILVAVMGWIIPILMSVFIEIRRSHNTKTEQERLRQKEAQA